MEYLFLFIAAGLLAFANGANDNFKAVATLYGSKTLNFRQALSLASIAQVLGSIASIFLASVLVKAFSGNGLLSNEFLPTGNFLIAVGLGAALTVLVATYFGLPISTTHALVGGLVGAGIAFCPEELNWSKLGASFLLPLLISPLLACCITYLFYPLLSRVRKRLGIVQKTCVCLGQTMQPVSFSKTGELVLEQSGLVLTIAEQSACRERYLGSFLGLTSQKLVDTLHQFSAFALGFARGLNDTPKILALLWGATVLGLDLSTSMIVLTLFMLLGGWFFSRGIAQTMGKKITEMNTGQGLIANLTASSLVIGASLMGSPVSTTHVSNGAIFGIGIWSGRARWNWIFGIILAWIGTLPLAVILAFIAAKIISV